MADETLREFTVGWMLTGTFMFCLIAFAVSFMLANNPGGLGTDTDNIFSSTAGNLSSNLLETPQNADTLLNITSNTNPEASDLGSRDIVATGFESKASAQAYWESGKNLIAWVFSGTTGQMLLAVFSGLFGIIVVFLIIKLIRIGT